MQTNTNNMFAEYYVEQSTQNFQPRAQSRTIKRMNDNGAGDSSVSLVFEEDSHLVKSDKVKNLVLKDQPVPAFHDEEHETFSGIPKLLSESDFADIQNMNQFESFLRSLLKKSVMTNKLKRHSQKRDGSSASWSDINQEMITAH